MAERQFGEIPGVPPGTLLKDRRALAAAGVHKPPVAGISGAAAEGSDSVVRSGGYEDGQHLGDVILHTGAGGNAPSTGKPVADQALAGATLALAHNTTTALPVRVPRGSRHPFATAPATGFRYDGLYYVGSYWQTTARSRYRI